MRMRLHGLGSEQKRCIMALSAGPRTDDSTKPGWRARVRYGFDNLMSRVRRPGSGCSVWRRSLWSSVVSSVAWFLAPADVQDNGNWLGVLWRSLLRTMDPGTMGGDEGSPVYLLLMFVVSLGGHLHRERAGRRADQRPRGQVRAAAQGPVPDHRAGPHRDPGLVGAGLHDRHRAGPGERERAPVGHRDPGRHGQGRDGGRDPPAGSATPAAPGWSAGRAARSSRPISTW